MRLDATAILCSLALASVVPAGTVLATTEWASTGIAALQDSAERGDREAMFRLGVMYASGRGVAEDDTRAAEWYRKAADKGDSRAMVHLAAMHTAGDGVRRDEDDARRWYQKAAEQGNTRAMTALGARCATGVGTARDDAAAVRWYTKAADAGDAHAMFLLGSMHARGRGTDRSQHAAFAWYLKAANAGSARAMTAVGAACATGSGTTANAIESVRWFARAAEAGDANGMANLGLAYLDGAGVPQNTATAVHWFRVAGEFGDVRSMVMLGDLHARGDETLEGIAVVILEKFDHGCLGDAEEHLELDRDLLEIGRVAFGFVFGGLLPDGDLGDRGDKGRLQAEALGFEGPGDLTEGDLHAAIARLHDIGAGRSHNDSAENQQADSDKLGEGLWTHDVERKKRNADRAGDKPWLDGRGIYGNGAVDSMRPARRLGAFECARSDGRARF
jgi:TPR repeat protein